MILSRSVLVYIGGVAVEIDESLFANGTAKQQLHYQQYLATKAVVSLHDQRSIGNTVLFSVNPKFVSRTCFSCNALLLTLMLNLIPSIIGDSNKHATRSGAAFPVVAHRLRSCRSS